MGHEATAFSAQIIDSSIQPLNAFERSLKSRTTLVSNPATCLQSFTIFNCQYDILLLGYVKSNIQDQHETVIELANHLARFQLQLYLERQFTMQIIPANNISTWQIFHLQMTGGTL